MTPEEKREHRLEDMEERYQRGVMELLLEKQQTLIWIEVQYVEEKALAEEIESVQEGEE